MKKAIVLALVVGCIITFGVISFEKEQMRVNKRIQYVQAVETALQYAHIGNVYFAGMLSASHNGDTLKEKEYQAKLLEYDKKRTNALDAIFLINKGKE